MWKLLLLVVGALAYDYRQYESYTLVKFDPRTENQIRALERFRNSEGIISMRRAIPGIQNEMLVSPEKFEDLQTFMSSIDLTYEVAEHNIVEEMKEEWDRMLARGYPDKMVYDINDYNTFSDIIGEVNNLAGQCAAGITCSTFSIGNSIEGREQRVLYMTGGTGRKAIFIDSLIHAREHLAGATAMNILDKMVKEYTTDADVARLVDNYDFYFLAVNNPDGYDYTWTDDRMWRKNRRDNAGSSCFGVDLNRNYDSQWSMPGASPNECAQDYHGPSAASEIETQNVANWVLNNPNIETDISVHMYGYYLLAPYGNCTRPPGWIDDLWPVMRDYCQGLEAAEGGDQWDCGNSCNALYETSGGSTDWMMETAGMKYSFVVEMRGNSFTEPASEIPISFAENWAALVLAVDQMILQATEP